MIRASSSAGLLILIGSGISGSLVSGQTHRIDIFPDEEYYRVIRALPHAEQLRPDFTLLDTHVEKSLGAQFDQITSLTTIYCQKTTAIDTMEKSISQLLSGMHFQNPLIWDHTFATLKASLEGRNLLNSSPPQFHRINLKVQIAQVKHRLQGFTIDYEVLASPQAHSNSWADISSTSEARSYLDDLRVKIRARIEQALNEHCEKASVGDITTEQEALQVIAKKYKLKPADVETIRAALRAEDE